MKHRHFQCIAAALVLAMLFSLVACGKNMSEVPLESLPKNYSLEDARRDGCLVLENGSVTAGEKSFSAFLEKCERGEAAVLRVAKYYTLGDPSRYEKSYYESIKDEYPKLFVHEVRFDGTSYQVTYYENGTRYGGTYAYLKHYAGEAESPYATYSHYDRYVLVNEEDVTWETMMSRVVSSHSDVASRADFFEVCGKLTYK